MKYNIKLNSENNESLESANELLAIPYGKKESFTVNMFFNPYDFHAKRLCCMEKNVKYFEVNLFEGVEIKTYDRTVYFQIIGSIKDEEVRPVINRFLDPKYNYATFVDIVELPKI